MKIKRFLPKVITWIRCRVIRYTSFIRNLQLRFFKYHSIEPIANLEKVVLKDIESEFDTVIQSNKFTVFDIFDIKKVAEKTGVEQTEALAYKAAFTAAKVLGMTKKRIIDSYYYYCGIVETFKSKYHETIDAQKEQIEKALTEEIDTIESSIESNKVKMQKLLRDNDLLCAKALALRNERSARVGKLLKIKDIVSSIYTDTISDLKAQMDKCTKYSEKDNE